MGKPCELIGVGLLVVCSSLCSWSLAHAQGDITLVDTRFEYTPEVDASDGPQAPSSWRWSIAGLAPIPLRRDVYLIVAPRYVAWRFIAESPQDDLTVHGISSSQTLRYPINPRWAVLGIVGVGLASDFRDVDVSHVRLSGGVVGQRRYHPRLALGAGIAASYSFGQLLPVPVLYADWRASDRLRVRAFLPSRFRVSYRVAPRLVVSAGAEVEGNRFSIQRDDLSQDLDVESLAVSRGSVQLRASVRIAGPLWAAAYLGHTVFRRLQVHDGDVEVADLSAEQSPVLGISLELIPPPRQAGR